LAGLKIGGNGVGDLKFGVYDGYPDNLAISSDTIY